MTPAEWPHGRAEIEALLRGRRLEQVPPSTDNALALIARARLHLATAEAVAPTDPDIGMDALHDANRKALEAVLLDQGLRTTRDGGHTAPYEAAKAQLRTSARTARPELFVYEVVRRLRHGADYASYEVHLTASDVGDDLADSHALVEICSRLVGSMPAFRPDPAR
ncbi:hypothetical protein [Cellulomonas pakistanensis]|uniref:Uncharacterized protein n=1 Tax=Cellulomonas pakistanensis TaxID=992287 RepID=A0A919U791_9CELL|nr:hypothetical protein [Cellulomonas pakistanensis]GIG37075.1 hypothetical protein Cpa01nite_24560 [Cellulomonas pakistanensis]